VTQRTVPLPIKVFPPGDHITYMMAAFIFLAGLTVLTALFLWFRSQQESVYISTKPTPTTKTGRPKVSFNPYQQKPSRHTPQKMQYPKLYGLLQGDRDAARRLVKQVMDANPNQSEAWCYEKAVQDLMRDRC